MAATSDIGSITTATVTSLGGLGDGIAQLHGQPLFISKSCVGDRLSVRITHHNAEGYTATIEEVLTPGPDRVSAPCPHFSACGGCTLQQLGQGAYHDFKTRMFHAALSRAGFTTEGKHVLFLPPATRRRVEFKTHLTKGQLQLAFYEPRSRTPVPLRTCLILTPELQGLMQPLQTALQQLPFAHLITAISLTRADSGIDCILHVSTTPESPKAALDHFIATLNFARVSLRTGTAAPAIISQRASITMRFGNIDVPLPPDAFLQATAEGQQALAEAVLAHIPAHAPVVDLFAGLGTYSFPLLARQRVHAVELDANMIAALKTLARAQPDFSAEQRDLFKNPLPPETLSTYHAAVINPPRLGAKAQTLALAASNISHVVMVSCNPATFGRDALALKNAGFTLQHTFAIDQFVYSPHLEIFASFQRK